MRAILFIAAFVTVSVGAMLYFGLYGVGDSHMTEVIIKKPYEEVYAALSDPEQYPTLFPQWVDSVEKVDDRGFTVHDRFGNVMRVETVMDEKKGVIDMVIGGAQSRTRVVDVGDGPLGPRTAILHVSKRWKDMSFFGWLFHKRIVNGDFKNVKKVLESSTH